jgi:DNA polymerase III sliding clamp (beta) subunit (PCNA family)
MRATVDAKEFSQTLNKVIKVIKRSRVPILEGALVQIKDGRCTLTATDFTTWLTAEIPAVGDDLSFVFQRPKDTAQACKHFEGRLMLETEGKSTGKDQWLQLTMSCGPRAAQVMAFLPEDYPAIPRNEARHTYTVNAAQLLERVEHVKYALKKPDTRLAAKFTHIQFGSNKVYGVDGHRLAWDVNDSLEVRQPFMVLPEALEYLKFFDDQEITAHMGENNLQMTNGTISIQTRIEGPLVFNVDGAVPKEFAEEFYIYPKGFLRELDYLKKMARNTDKAYIYFSGDRLSLTAVSGNYSTQVEIDGTHNIGFGFELCYMVDALRQFREMSYVKMKVNSSVAPIILEAEGRSDYAMVLPVRIRQAVAA